MAKCCLGRLMSSVVMVVSVVNSEPHVPCYFIFRDSLVDNGNNNNIASLARANYAPYGIDFPGGPTGRFTNGLTTVQRNLQLRIEAQGKYLQSVFEKAQETLGKQNLGSAGLETAKVQLSELVSKVSNECFSNAFPGLEEMSSQTLQTHPAQLADGSMDICLTACEVSQKGPRNTT